MAERAMKFEELLAWQKARQKTQQVFKASAGAGFSRDRFQRDQIRRAAVSVMSNIAEGWERASRQDEARMLDIAKASCAEVRSQLYVARDAGHLNGEEFVKLVEMAMQVSRITSGLRKSLLKR